MRKFLKIIAGLVVIVGCLLLAATFLDTTERAPTFDAPGHLTTEITVPGRASAVVLHIWYPTDSDAPPSLIGQNGLFYGSHIRANAHPLAGPLPVLLISHGSGGNAERLGWLAGFLAHQGIIVVAPNHPGTTSGDSDPFKTPLIWERTDDLRAALDLLQTNPPGGLQPDMARVGVLGFSLGGYSALGFSGLRVTKAAFIAHCAANPDAADCSWMVQAGVDFTTIDAARYDADLGDARVIATVAIDPALVGAIDAAALPTVDHPVLLINLGAGAEIPAAMEVGTLAQTLPNATYLAVPGAQHFSFLAECSTLGKIIIAVAGEDNICSDAGLRDRVIIQDELRTSIAAFLNTHLVKQ